MTKIVAVLLMISVLAGGSVWAWSEYESRSEKDLITEKLREVSVLTGRQLAMNMSDDISFAEHISRSERSIEAVESALVTLKSHRFSRQKDAAEAAVEFSTDAQSVLRGLLAQARLQLGVSIASDRSKEAMSEIKGAKNQYALEASIASAKKATADYHEALDKAIKVQKTNREILGRFYASDYKVKGFLGQDEGLDEASLSALSAIKRR